MSFVVEVIEYGTGDVLQAVAFENEQLARSVERGVERILAAAACDTHYVLMTEDDCS